MHLAIMNDPYKTVVLLLQNARPEVLVRAVWVSVTVWTACRVIMSMDHVQECVQRDGRETTVRHSELRIVSCKML